MSTCSNQAMIEAQLLSFRHSPEWEKESRMDDGHILEACPQSHKPLPQGQHQFQLAETRMRKVRLQDCSRHQSLQCLEASKRFGECCCPQMRRVRWFHMRSS